MSTAPNPTGGPARSSILDTLAQELARWGAGEERALAPLVAAQLADFSDAELATFAERVASTGATWGYYPADPVGRRISRFAHRLVLRPGSELHASPALERARRQPVFFVANHLSYIDANVIDALLVAGGFGDVADRLTVLAGPKVYQRPIRRLASLCFGTIKIPQSQSVASGEAVMPRREVARLALETLATVERRRAEGEHVLIFIEGSRSRTGAMARVLPAAARYFEGEGAIVVPLGLVGSEKLVPLDIETVTPCEVQLRTGRAVPAAELFARANGKRPVVADALGFLMAELLPPEYRGEYARSTPELAAAHVAAASFFG